MTSVFAARLGSALALLEKSRRVPLIGFLLMSGFAWSPASAEPCPNEWNAYVQLGSASQRAQAQSWSDEYRYVIGTQTFDVNTEVYGTLGRREIWKNDPVSLRKAAQILIAQSARSQPVTGAQYRYGACRALARAAQLERGSGRPVKHSFPTPLPNIAAKPARPAKMAPWSTKAMSTHFGLDVNGLDPKLAAARADALASCSVPIGQYRIAVKLASMAEANLLIEGSQLGDASLNADLEDMRKHISKLELEIASGGLNPGAVHARRAAACTYRRRIAQLEGSPLIAGAVDGSLTPLSIGGQTPPWKQQGKDARVIASDGKSAMHCVRLEQVASGDSAISGGGRRLFNGCSEEVEITWCNTPGCGTPTGGNSWTVQPGRGWPVSANGDVRWAACLGRDTASFVKGSHGLRYFCSAPAKK